jgi:Ca2+-binding EF-hand superfamily protein
MESVTLKRTILSLIASRIPEDQIKELRKSFSKIDQNGDGSLSMDELSQGLHEIKGFKESKITPEDV